MFLSGWQPKSLDNAILTKTELSLVKKCSVFDQPYQMNLMIQLTNYFIGETEKAMNCRFTALGIIVALVALASCTSEMANYPLLYTMKSGDHKLLTASTLGPATKAYGQSFFETFSNLPVVAIGIRDIQVSGAATNGSTISTIDYYCSIGDITTTTFRTYLTLTSPITFGLLYYMYIGMDLVQVADTYMHPYSINLTGSFNDTEGVTVLMSYNVSETVSDFSNAVVTTLPMSFSLSTSHQFSFFVSSTMTASSTIQLNFTSNSNLQRMEVTVFVVDKTSMQASYTYYIDAGYFQATGPSEPVVSTFSPPSFNYYNYIIGLTAMQVDGGINPNFFQTPSDTFGTNTQYIFLQHNALHWRKRQCISPSTINKFVFEEQLCYDACPSGYATNSSLDYCVLCDSTCETCQVDGVSCTGCPSGSHRTLTNSACPCDVGYFHNDTVVCATCDYTCYTCQIVQSNCTACDATRTLTSNTCPCSTGYYDTNNQSQVCGSCHYSCLTCSGGTSTSCSSCDSGNFRVYIQSTHECLCQSGYEDTGAAPCSVSSVSCSSPCLTCKGSSTNCTSCSSTALASDRVLSGNSCVCPQYYTAASSTATCTEICGNSLMPSGTTKGCDDGNVLDGDGCSSTCQAQSGFSCDGSQPSICLSDSGYSVISQTLTKDSGSNYLTATLELSPVPPASTEPTLANLQSYLQLQSYTLNRATVTLRMLLLQEVASSQVLNVRLSLIGTTAGVPMVDSNNLQLIPYTETYYDVYKVQEGLVWTYIALLWAAALYRLISDPRLISQVTEVFFYSALVFIAAGGQQLSTAPLVPLLKLKYLFGYNIQLQNNSLFSVYNLGLLYLVFPLVLYLIFLFASKKCPGSVTSRTKRFVLYDLSFAWLMVNGYLIMYGLSLAITKGQSFSGVTAVGVVFGVIYLVLMCIICYRSFFRDPSFSELTPTLEYTKKNLFKPRLFSISWLVSLLVCFVYLSIKKKTEANPLLMIIYFLLMFVVVGVAGIYINKIRVLLNFISLMLIYGCVLLVNYVTEASWIGMVIVALMFVQLLVNFLLMHLEKNNLKVDDEEELDEKAKAGKEEQEARDREAEQTGRGQLLADHTGLFTIYQPAKHQKPKAQQIEIDPVQFQHQQESVLTPALKQNDIARVATQKKNKLNDFLMTSPKNKAGITVEKEQQEFIDLENREVDMNDF